MGNSRFDVGLDQFLAAVVGERDPASAAAFAADILYEYSPDQPRDEKGRWTTGGSHDEGKDHQGKDKAGLEERLAQQDRAAKWFEDGDADAVERMSASQFYDAWKAGNLPPVVVFGSDARMSRELRADVALDKARKILAGKMIGDYVGHGGAMGNWPSQKLTNLPLGGARDYGTGGALYKDFSDIFNDNTPGYVGTFSVSALPQDVQVSYSQGMENVTAVVCFEAYNVMHTLSRNKYFTAGSERAASGVWSNELTPFVPESNVEMYFRWTEVMHYSRVIGSDKETVWFEVSDKPLKLPYLPKSAIARRPNFIDYRTPPVGFSNGSRADYRRIGVVLP